MENDEKIEHLNELLHVSHDGENGYRAAATQVNDPHMKQVFEDYAVQRAGFRRDLRSEIERLGGAPADSGTLSASVHRGWLELKSAVTGGDAAAVIAACETGEDAAQAAYERVVKTGITGEARTLAENQWSKIREAHARLLNLKNSLAKAE